MKAQTGPLTALMLLLAELASAQDALRNSLAGDAAAEAQRQQQGSEQYTYKAGDFRLLVAPSMEMDWNDNVNLAKTDTESDFILDPSLNLTASYPLTQANLLSLSVGVGYSDYLHYSTYSRMDVTSGSQLSFDMYIKDFAINLHDRFSMTEDSSTEAAVAGTALLGTLVNTAGLSTTWDLKDLVLTAGYDHQNSLSVFGAFNYLDRSSELLLARAGVHWRPDLTVGLESTAAFTAYDQAVLNNNQSYSAGAYADWKPGLYFDVQPRAGYTIYQFQHTSRSSIPMYYLGVPPDVNESVQTQDMNAWYADLTVSHQAAKAVSYALSAGHEIQLGIQSDVVEDSYIRPNITWAILKDLNVNTSFFYEHGNTGTGNVTGNLAEIFDWYGGALMVSYPLMKRLLLSLNYRLTFRSSSVADRDYAQDVVGLHLSYQLP